MSVYSHIGLLIFNHRGHFTHFAHLEWQALQTLGEVTIIGPRASLDSEEFASSFSGEKVSLEYFEGKEAQAVCHYACKDKYQVLFSNGLDSYWHKLLLRLLWWKVTGQLKTRISGILLSIPFVYPENSCMSFKFIRKFLLRQLAPLCYHRIYVIDEIAYGLLLGTNNVIKLNNVFRLLEDPIENPPLESQKELRELLGWSHEERILLAIGVIVPEKRMDLLIHAFLDAEPQKNQRLIIIGRFSKTLLKEYSDILKFSPFKSQVSLCDRWLSDREVTEYISAADYIAVTYPFHFANASILFRAQKAGKPTLLSNRGWLGRYGKIHNCGIIVDTTIKENYSQGVKKVFEETHSCLEGMSSVAHSEASFIQKIIENESL